MNTYLNFKTKFKTSAYTKFNSNSNHTYQVAKVFIIKEKFARGGIAAPGESNCFSRRGFIFGCHTS